MAETITRADLEDAKLDAQALADVVNGAADAPIVVSRLGRALRTLAWLESNYPESIFEANSLFLTDVNWLADARALCGDLTKGKIWLGGGDITIDAMDPSFASEILIAGTGVEHSKIGLLGRLKITTNNPAFGMFYAHDLESFELDKGIQVYGFYGNDQCGIPLLRPCVAWSTNTDAAGFARYRRWVKDWNNYWGPLGLNKSWFQALTIPVAGSINVTGATNAGGLIKLIVTSTAGWATNEVKKISGIVGSILANGTWKITVNDATHITLQGSVYSGSYTSGGVVTCADFKAMWNATYTWCTFIGIEGTKSDGRNSALLLNRVNQADVKIHAYNMNQDVHNFGDAATPTNRMQSFLCEAHVDHCDMGVVYTQIKKYKIVAFGRNSTQQQTTPGHIVYATGANDDEDTDTVSYCENGEVTCFGENIFYGPAVKLRRHRKCRASVYGVNFRNLFESGNCPVDVYGGGYDQNTCVLQAPIAITAMTKANPCVITLASDPKICEGRRVTLQNVLGITNPDGAAPTYYVMPLLTGDVPDGTRRYALYKIADGSAVNSTAWVGAFTSGDCYVNNCTEGGDNTAGSGFGSPVAYKVNGQSTVTAYGCQVYKIPSTAYLNNDTLTFSKIQEQSDWYDVDCHFEGSYVSVVDDPAFFNSSGICKSQNFKFVDNVGTQAIRVFGVVDSNLVSIINPTLVGSNIVVRLSGTSSNCSVSVNPKQLTGIWDPANSYRDVTAGGTGGNSLEILGIPKGQQEHTADANWTWTPFVDKLMVRQTGDIAADRTINFITTNMPFQHPPVRVINDQNGSFNINVTINGGGSIKSIAKGAWADFAMLDGGTLKKCGSGTVL